MGTELNSGKDPRSVSSDIAAVALSVPLTLKEVAFSLDPDRWRMEGSKEGSPGELGRNQTAGPSRPSPSPWALLCEDRGWQGLQN